MPSSDFKVLFFGDIVGKAGRKALELFLPQLKTKFQPDVVIANGENAAGGLGLTPKIADELLSKGIDIITSGNHIWKKREIFPYLEKSNQVIRPANYPLEAPGKGWTVIDVNGFKLGIVNLEGRVFMKPLECPFRTAQRIVSEIRGITPNIIVDFHAEATSEKRAMGWFLDGQVSAVVGTHTHVQTADEEILPQGTGYITDIGMTGALNSVIGMEIEPALKGFLTQLPQRFKPAKNRISIQGIVLKINPYSGKCCKISRIREVGNGY